MVKYVASEFIWNLKFRLHIHNIIIIITFISVSGDVQICEFVWYALCGDGGGIASGTGGGASRFLARGKPEKKQTPFYFFKPFNRLDLLHYFF